jgi:SAM-dependent methyltransferase
MGADPMSDDGVWSLGDYTLLAEQLAPAAAETVAAAAPGAGSRVLDLGCGTGNAAALCVRRGARVIGVDPARRLLELAATRVPEAEFRFGDAAEIPVDSGAIDVVVSVFAVIFAPDAAAAASEVLRVLAPGGRLVLSAWLPDNALAEVSGMRRQAVGGGRGRHDVRVDRARSGRVVIRPGAVRGHGLRSSAAVHRLLA